MSQLEKLTKMATLPSERMRAMIQEREDTRERERGYERVTFLRETHFEHLQLQKEAKKDVSAFTIKYNRR